MNIGEPIGLKDIKGHEILIGDKLLIESCGYWAEILVIWQNYSVTALYQNTKGGDMRGKNHTVYFNELFGSNSTHQWKIIKL